MLSFIALWLTISNRLWYSSLLYLLTIPSKILW
jgi:hypothetical protein